MVRGQSFLNLSARTHHLILNFNAGGRGVGEGRGWG